VRRQRVIPIGSSGVARSDDLEVGRDLEIIADHDAVAVAGRRNLFGHDTFG